MNIEDADDLMDRIALVADDIDSILLARALPAPQQIAEQALVMSLTGIRNRLRNIVFEYTGENPWRNHVN